ncbi:MAG: helix-turn-helix domain-containing protein [Candidatus Aenigmarchaeota archaeon]|nr:helix-turn-helix domain-containing protein [Candidatus Aenigmarchaeota archaeon]MDI6722384.1 helix-turn-helix domain-containing protein [Candidatus Aenigmarchaeota archaeon]
MHEDLLSEIGFTKSEIAVYFALIEIGSSTTGPIIKKAGIASGKAYLILDKLITKGLVTFVIKSGVKYYQAKDPERIIDYMKEKESELRKKEEKMKEILPYLKQKYEQKKHENIAEIYEGDRGLKTFYEFVLKEIPKGECIFVMGATREVLEKFDRYLMSWNKRRIKLGIRMKIIYNHDCRNLGKKRKNLRLTEVRYMKPEMETPAWVDIFMDYVVTINVHGTPVCFLIKSKEAADSYMKYFELVWKQAAKS